MTKKIIIGSVIGVVLLGVGIFYSIKGASYKEALEEAKAVTSYVLECNMEMMENDELRSYYVEVAYQKEEKQEYYKVALQDKALNQTQVILLNKEGVYVVTPSLNQVFKFQSDWPNNSPKPYIYSSLLEMLDENKVEKVKDGYSVKGPMTYPSDARVASQEVFFTKDLQPKNVFVYDKDETSLIHVEVVSYTPNKKIDLDTFNQETIMKDYQTSIVQDPSELPLYPVSALDSTLVSETVSTVQGTSNHILKFDGENNFTVVQRVVSPNEQVVIEEITDQAIEFVNGVAFCDENQVSMIQGDVYCQVYSNDLSQEEMLGILSSLQIAPLK